METGTQFLELSYQAFLTHIRHSWTEDQTLVCIGSPFASVFADLSTRKCRVLACSSSPDGYEQCVCFKQGSDIQQMAEYACIDKEEMQAALLSLGSEDFLWLRPHGQPFIIRHKPV